MPGLSPILSVMTRAIEKASKSLLRDFGEVEQLQVSVKGPGDFVSAADKRAEQILYAELSKARPDYAFLMEEAGAIGNQKAEFRFIIDPLDGTSNFLHGIPHWAISVGLERQGEMVAGVVFDAVKQEMFYAEKGSGAYMNDRRIRVSGRKELNTSIVAVSSGPGQYPLNEYESNISDLRKKCEKVRIFGASAIDMAYIASGRIDCFIGYDVKLWDVAAGMVLIKEAGGSTFDTDKISITKNEPGMIAANAHLMQKLKDVIGV